jgi:hypothetical protein
LTVIKHGRACPEPDKVLKSRLARGRHELLMAWKGQATTSATWMDLEEFRRLYPAFQLEDELLIQGGRDVMWGLSYKRRQWAKPGCSAQEHAKGGVLSSQESRVSLNPSRLEYKTELY